MIRPSKIKSLGLLSLTLLLIIGCSKQDDRVKTLEQTELSAKLNEENVVLIDVRTPAEVSDGYIPEADLFIDINAADFEQRISELDTAKSYVVYCRSGGRSGRAASQMVTKGFSQVFNLKGGILAYTGELKK